MRPGRDAYVTAMARSPREDDVDRVLRLLDGLSARGIVPTSVSLGDVEVRVHGVVRKVESEAQASEPSPRSYVGQALAGLNTTARQVR